MNDIFNMGTFLKFLSKNKLYTAVDILGLSVSLMFVILIAIYTIQELSTDRFHEKADRIYILGNERHLGSAYRIAGHIQEQFPEIEKTCPINSDFKNISVSAGGKNVNANLLLTDSTFFDVFSFKLITKNKKDALIAKNYAVISETFARKAFGNTDPVGQSIQIKDLSFIVNGVMTDIKNSTIPYSDILLRFENVTPFNPSLISETFDNSGGTNIFILEKENANLKVRADDMVTFFKKINFWVYKRELQSKVIFVPIKDIYFSEIQSADKLRHGDWKFVMLLMSVGIITLVFAVINYINLTVAQTGFRAKEMATRRLLGSTRYELIVRIVFEAVFLCLLSFLLALFLAFACAPYASALLEREIDIIGAISPLSLLLVFATVILLGIISGMVPAIVISNAHPIEVVKGRFNRKNKMVFSKFFITFQNIITMMLLAAAITISFQTNYLINAPLGYNKANIINIPTDNFENKEEIAVFADGIRQLAAVKRIAFAQGTPFDRGNNWSVNYDGKNISFQVLGGDTAYFEMLGLQKIKENGIATPGSFYLTPQALKETGLDEDALTFKLGGQNPSIAGIFKDIQLGNITHSLQPVLFWISDFKNNLPWNVLVEIQGNPDAGYQQVKEVFERTIGIDFNGDFIEYEIEKSFASQQRISKIISIFSAIAVLISFLGLFAMSTYYIRQRSKEIAIRKVLSSGNFEILSKLVVTFLSYVLIAFVIATPIIWYLMQQWLSDYAYRINLSPLIFISAGLLCLFFSLVSVLWQSWKAATANPVDTIKTE